jgi:hypothetical protein
VIINECKNKNFRSDNKKGIAQRIMIFGGKGDNKTPKYLTMNNPNKKKEQSRKYKIIYKKWDCPKRSRRYF